MKYGKSYNKVKKVVVKILQGSVVTLLHKPR